jgi:hypothetical protein
MPDMEIEISADAPEDFRRSFGIPASVTYAQMAEACKVLGLEGSKVLAVRMDARQGIDAQIMVAVGVRAEVHIPIGRSE